MPFFFNLFNTVLEEDEYGIAPWIEDLPLPKEPYAKENARDACSVYHTLKATQQSIIATGRRDLVYPSPWQDRMDRPEVMLATFSTFGLVMGLFKGAKVASLHGPTVAKQAGGQHSKKKLLVAGLFGSGLKYYVSFTMMGCAILAGDRMYMDWRRRIAVRQGVELEQTQDVTRTPMAYGMAGALGGSMFTFMDVYRPTPLFRNLLRWAIPSFMVGYFVGIVKVALQRAVEREVDSTAIERFREAVRK